MIFAKPGYLFLLLLLIPFFVLAVYNFQKKKRLLAGLVSMAAAERMVVRSGREIDLFKTSLIVMVFILLILALARPQWGERVEPLDVRGLEMIFLLDTSASMQAEDVKPDRLAAAKQLINRLLDTLRTDYVALINFAGVSYVQCPLTLDYEAFKLMVEASVISPGEEQGTDFSTAFTLAAKSFANSKSKSKVLVLITDGEDLEKRWQKPFAELKKSIPVFTVGIGVADGAPIPVRDGGGAITEWKKDKQGGIVKTSLDEATLLTIARESGGQYFRLADISGIDSFQNILQTFERKALGQKLLRRKIERY
jgi:Ca-activated chloride channel homolog